MGEEWNAEVVSVARLIKPLQDFSRIWASVAAVVELLFVVVGAEDFPLPVVAVGLVAWLDEGGVFAPEVGLFWERIFWNSLNY